MVATILLRLLYLKFLHLVPEPGHLRLQCLPLRLERLSLLLERGFGLLDALHPLVLETHLEVEHLFVCDICEGSFLNVVLNLKKVQKVIYRYVKKVE